MTVNKILLLLLLLTLPGVPGLGADGLADLPKGKITARIVIDTNGDDEFGVYTDTRRCFENHLDYFLWHRGWDYEIQDAEFNNSMKDSTILNDPEPSGYSLKITASPEIISFSARNRDARSRDYYINYPVFDRISVSAVLIDRANEESVLYSRKIELSREEIWLDVESMYDIRESPEPPDNMIRRALNHLLGELPQQARKITIPEDEIPLFLVLDEAYREKGKEDYRGIIEEAVEYASHVFYRQFGYGFKVQGVSYMNLPGADLSGMNKNHMAVMRNVQPAMSCLIAAVYIPRDGFNYYNRGKSFHVGLSNIGKRQMITAHIPPPDQGSREWESFINGILFLHEAGHLLGGVHVSDAGSIMYHQSPWTSSITFDRLNRDIIERVLENDYPLRKVSSYLELVMTALENTGYDRADFGQFLYEFAEVNPRFDWPDNLFDSDIRRSAAYLLEGVSNCRAGDYEKARAVLYRALALTPEQGAIHYWLYRTTEGNLAKKHLVEAARLGFSDAVFELMWME